MAEVRRAEVLTAEAAATRRAVILRAEAAILRAADADNPLSRWPQTHLGEVDSTLFEFSQHEKSNHHTRCTDTHLDGILPKRKESFREEEMPDNGVRPFAAGSEECDLHCG